MKEKIKSFRFHPAPYFIILFLESFKTMILLLSVIGADEHVFWTAYIRSQWPHDARLSLVSAGQDLLP
jgi:hypothetical protein